MKHHDGLDLLIFFLAILAVTLALLFLMVFLAHAAPSNPLWFVADQLPGYATDCKAQCTIIPTIDPYIRFYTLWAEKGTITGTRFHFKHVLLSDLTLLYGQPAVLLGDNAYWYNLSGFSPILLSLHATLSEGLVTELEGY